MKFLESNDSHGTYNASDVGLGKTAMSIECINRLNSPKTLIVCPSVVKLNWGDELVKWYKTDYDRLLLYFNKSTEITHIKTTNYDLTIVSYGLIRQKGVAEVLAKQKYEVLILDESHYVKNSKAITTNAVLRVIWPNVRYRICLSATPFIGSISDCYTTFSRLAPKLFPNYYDFVDYFCEKEESQYGTKYVGSKHADELKALIRHYFFVRQTADEVGLALPEKIWTQIKLPHDEFSVKLTETEKEKQKEYLKELKRSFATGSNHFPKPPIALATKRHDQGLKKIPAIVEFVKNLLDSAMPTVVYFVHLDCIEEFTKQLKDYNPTVITGEKTEDQRYISKSDFGSGKTDLLVCQIKAGGIGINLIRGKACVFGELSYSPADIEQCIGRVRRQGNTNKSTFIYYFVTKDTIEEEIESIVMEKSKTFKQILDT